MARWAADGSRIPTNLFEAAAWRRGVKPVCRCGHSAVFDPHCLWWRFERRGWDERLEKALARFWCICCKWRRSEEHTSELQSLIRISYAVFCLKKKKL